MPLYVCASLWQVARRAKEKQPNESLIGNKNSYDVMYSRSLSPDLSSEYLCGRVRAKCRHNNIASIGNCLACHLQMAVTHSKNKNKQVIISGGAEYKYLQ